MFITCGIHKDTSSGGLCFPSMVALFETHNVFLITEEEDENLVKPSLAFCKALDNEEEYDQIDEMASRSLGGHPPRDTLPDRRMEVCPTCVSLKPL